jgi:glutaredoxin
VSVLTLYGKPGCHLCEGALAVARGVAERRGLALQEVDVTLDPVLERRYGERIPVLAVDGEELFEYFIDGSALEERLDICASDRRGRASRDR